MTSLLNSPWIDAPVEEISFTLPSLTSCRKVGLYGTLTRVAGDSALEEIQKLSASSATTKARIPQRPPGILGPL